MNRVEVCLAQETIHIIRHEMRQVLNDHQCKREQRPLLCRLLCTQIR